MNDGDLWRQVFDQVDGQLAKNLQEMRALGTRIRQGKYGFILVPGGDFEQYQINRDRLLGPYRKQLKEILTNLQIEIITCEKCGRQCVWLRDDNKTCMDCKAKWYCRNCVDKRCKEVQNYVMPT